MEIQDLRKRVEVSVEFIRTLTNSSPEIGIILGTGLGNFAQEIDIEVSIPYERIPNFPISTVESHSGNLILGKLSGKSVLAMEGRFHLYEGYSMQTITFPLRVAKMLGSQILIVSNACGSLNPLIPKGNLMLIDDHINLMNSNPLIGKNDDYFGPRFPDMSQPYSKRLIEIAEKVALDKKIKLHKGVYAAMTGPSLETRAEYRMLQIIGADVIGMSTIPETIVAVHMGMEVLGVSVTTDECLPDLLKPVSLNEIIEIAKATEPKLTMLIKEVIKHI